MLFRYVSFCVDGLALFFSSFFLRWNYCCCFHFWFCAAWSKYTKAVFFRTGRRRSLHSSAQKHSYQWVVCICMSKCTYFLISLFMFCAAFLLKADKGTETASIRPRAFIPCRAIGILFEALFKTMCSIYSWWHNSIPKILYFSLSIWLHFFINSPLHFVRNRFQNQ